MICKKCAAEFDDSLKACPECSEEVSEETLKKKAFKVTINSDEAFVTAAAEEKTAETETNEAEPETAEDAGISAEEQGKKELSAKEKRFEKTKAKKQEKLKAQKKKEKGASRFIVSSVALMAVIMVALSALSIATDVFEEDKDTVKTMALSSLSSADAGELEAYLSKLYALREMELDDDTASDELYPYFMPYSEGGIYSKLQGNAKLITDSADPAKRFADEEGTYAYYKIEAEKIDAIIEKFGLVPNHTLNLKDIYYHSGSYYFSKLENGEEDFAVEADVVSSKRIQDGSYYVDCVFYNTGSNEGRQKGEIYAIVSKETVEGSSESNWIISRLSSEPLFDESGIMIENDGTFKYEMRREQFSGLLSDGTVFCEYSVEYPYFKGESQGEKAANLLYSEVLSQYKKSAEEADKYFEEYTGKKEALPIVVHISSEVTYTDDKYISTIVDISEYNPEDIAETQEESEEASAVTLANRSVEGYIFDTETGEYVSKDAIVGKDYQLVSDILYRIHGGYEYADLLDESIPRPSEIPPDDVIGKSIYESGSSITPGGYVFCLVTPEGYVESVLLPNDVLNLLKE